ncbi:hypothetical protein CGRA01v4_05264 [Colletotrichum graminicola]|nr:hypothetical protein CGRA01v4_05264 [Colletotrichum graminicola]
MHSFSLSFSSFSFFRDVFRLEGSDYRVKKKKKRKKEAKTRPGDQAQFCPRVPGEGLSRIPRCRTGRPFGRRRSWNKLGSRREPTCCRPPFAVAGGGRVTSPWPIETGEAVMFDSTDWSERYGLLASKPIKGNPSVSGHDRAVCQVLAPLVPFATRLVDQVGGFEGSLPISRGSKFFGCSTGSFVSASLLSLPIDRISHSCSLIGHIVR